MYFQKLYTDLENYYQQILKNVKVLRFENIFLSHISPVANLYHVKLTCLEPNSKRLSINEAIKINFLLVYLLIEIIAENEEG